ncbi:MAG TPA: sugar phosphate isomerase/epimerase, partial [Verrucomicrobiales bacterium]|nr:sugar phosphate isomerase/epimerase [Verrucomicrobiales bacterium]
MQTRRKFIAGATASVAALAADPFGRKGPANLRLSLAAYSFRNHFAFM